MTTKCLIFRFVMSSYAQYTETLIFYHMINYHKLKIDYLMCSNATTDSTGKQ